MAASDGVVDLTGRGLQFLLSFDTSQAQSSLGSLQPSMDQFLKALSDLKAAAGEASQSVQNMMSGASASFDQASIMGLLIGGPTKIQAAGSAMDTFAQGMKEHLRQLRQSMRLLDGDTKPVLDKFIGMSNAAANTKLPKTETGSSGGSSITALGLAGGGRGLIPGLASLGGLIGMSGAINSAEDAAVDLSMAIDRLGSSFGLNEGQLKAWREGIVALQNDVGGTGAEISKAARLLMEMNAGMRTFGGASPFLKSAVEMSRLHGNTVEENAALLGMANQLGLLTKSEVPGFAAAVSEAMTRGSGDIADMQRSLQELMPAFKQWRDQMIKGGMSAEQARAQVRSLVVETSTLMRQLKEHGVSFDVTSALSSLQNLTRTETLSLVQILNTQGNLARTSQQRIREAIDEGNIPEIIRGFAAVARQLEPGIEKIITPLIQKMGAALGNDVSRLISALSVLPQSVLDTSSKTFAKYSENISNMRQRLAQWDQTTGGMKERIGFLTESIRQQQGAWMETSGVLKTVYTSFQELLLLLHRFPTATRAFVGALATASLLGTIGTLVRVAGFAGGGLKSLAATFGMATTAAGALAAVVTKLSFVAVFASIGYLIARLTGLDKQIQSYDWSNIGGDLLRAVQATATVVGGELASAWGVVKNVVMSIKSAIDGIIDSMSPLINALKTAVSYVANLSPVKALRGAVGTGMGGPAGAVIAGNPALSDQTGTSTLMRALGYIPNVLGNMINEFKELQAQSRREQAVVNQRSQHLAQQSLNQRAQQRSTAGFGMEQASFSGRVGGGGDDVRQYALSSGNIIAQEIRRQLSSMTANMGAAGNTSIQNISNGISSDQLLLRMDAVSRDVAQVSRLATVNQSTSTNTGVQFAPAPTGVRIISAPPPHLPQAPAITISDPHRVTRQEIQALMDTQARAGIQQVTAMKTDNTELISVIREVASQVASQVSYHAQARDQVAPPRRFDVAAPWSPSITGSV